MSYDSVYTPVESESTTLAKQSAGNIHMPLYMAFLNLSASAKLLLHYACRRDSYGKHLIGTNHQIGRERGLTPRQVRDAIKETVKAGFIEHRKIDGKTHHIRVCWDAINAAKLEWIESSQILKGDHEQRIKQANQVIVIPANALKGKGKDVVIAGAIMGAFCKFFVSLIKLSRESHIKVSAFKTALKVGLSSKFYYRIDGAYCKVKNYERYFWQCLVEKLNLDVQRRWCDESVKNNVIENVVGGAPSITPDEAQQGLSADSTINDDSGKMTRLKDISSTYTYSNTNYVETNCIDAKRAILAGACLEPDAIFTACELQKRFNQHGIDATFTDVIQRENAAHPRTAGNELTSATIANFLTYHAITDAKKPVTYWIRQLVGWARMENRYHIKRPPAKSGTLSEMTPLDWSATGLSHEDIGEIIAYRASKDAPITQRTINNWTSQFALSRERGVTNSQILNAWFNRGWNTYKDAWLDECNDDIDVDFEYIKNLWNYLRPHGAPSCEFMNGHRKSNIIRLFKQMKINQDEFECYMSLLVTDKKFKHYFADSDRYVARNFDWVIHPKTFMGYMEFVNARGFFANQKA